MHEKLFSSSFLHSLPVTSFSLLPPRNKQKASTTLIALSPEMSLSSQSKEPYVLTSTP